MDIYLLKDHPFGIYNGRQGSCWVQPLARPASGPADASSLTLQLIFVILNRQSRTGSADLKGKKSEPNVSRGSAEHLLFRRHLELKSISKIMKSGEKRPNK